MLVSTSQVDREYNDPKKQTADNPLPCPVSELIVRKVALRCVSADPHARSNDHERRESNQAVHAQRFPHSDDCGNRPFGPPRESLLTVSGQLCRGVRAPDERQCTTNEVWSVPTAPHDTSIVHRPRVAFAGIFQVQRSTVNTGRRVWPAVMIDGLDPKWTRIEQVVVEAARATSVTVPPGRTGEIRPTAAAAEEAAVSPNSRTIRARNARTTQAYDETIVRPRRRRAPKFADRMGCRWTKGSGKPTAASVGSPLCSRRAYPLFDVR